MKMYHSLILIFHLLPFIRYYHLWKSYSEYLGKELHICVKGVLVVQLGWCCECGWLDVVDDVVAMLSECVWFSDRSVCIKGWTFLCIHIHLYVLSYPVSLVFVLVINSCRYRKKIVSLRSNIKFTGYEHSNVDEG